MPVSDIRHSLSAFVELGKEISIKGILVNHNSTRLIFMEQAHANKTSAVSKSSCLIAHFHISTATLQLSYFHLNNLQLLDIIL